MVSEWWYGFTCDALYAIKRLKCQIFRCFLPPCDMVSSVTLSKMRKVTQSVRGVVLCVLVIQFHTWCFECLQAIKVVDLFWVSPMLSYTFSHVMLCNHFERSYALQQSWWYGFICDAWSVKRPTWTLSCLWCVFFTRETDPLPSVILKRSIWKIYVCSLYVLAANPWGTWLPRWAAGQGRRIRVIATHADVRGQYPRQRAPQDHMQFPARYFCGAGGGIFK